MKHLLEILRENGYMKWSKSCIFQEQNANAKSQNELILKNKEKYNVHFVKGNDKNGTFYFQNYGSDFSTMRVGGLESYYIKDNDFNNPIIWGLHEKDKPQTLIYPRPFFEKIEIINGIKYTIVGLDDDGMNDMLKNRSHEEIFKEISKIKN